MKQIQWSSTVAYMIVAGLQAMPQNCDFTRSRPLHRGKILRWRNRVRLYRPLSVWVDHIVIDCSVIRNIKLPGSRKGAAPPPAVKAIRNGPEGRLAALPDRHHRCSALRNQLQFWCETSCARHSAAWCREQSCMLAVPWVSWRTGTSPSSSSPLWILFSQLFRRDSSPLVFLPISP